MDNNTFVRKDFYVAPPANNASPEQWQEWLEADKRETIKAKRAFTKSQEHCELPEFAQESTMRRVNGVWKQTTAIGFAGDVEAGGSLEPTVEASQMRDYILARMGGTKRGTKNTRTKNERRKLRRARRKIRQAKNKGD